MTVESRRSDISKGPSPVEISGIDFADGDDIRYYGPDYESDYYDIREYSEPADSETIRKFMKDPGDLQE